MPAQVMTRVQAGWKQALARDYRSELVQQPKGGVANQWPGRASTKLSCPTYLVNLESFTILHTPKDRATTKKLGKQKRHNAAATAVLQRARLLLDAPRNLQTRAE